MKRMICWVLVLAMMLGFVNMTSLQAFADANLELDFDDLIQKPGPSYEMIRTMQIDLPCMTHGAAISEVPEVAVISDYVTFTVQWGTKDHEMPAHTVYQAGTRYPFALTVTAKSGYAFAEGIAPDFHGVNAIIMQDINEERTQIIYSVEMMPTTSMVDYAQLSDVPSKITAGAVPNMDDLCIVEGNMEVASVRWLNEDKSAAVTTFQDGKIYYLEVTVKPMDGLYFADKIDVWSEGYGYDECVVNNDQEAVVYFRYSLQNKVGLLQLTVNSPAEGMNISDLTATLVGDAVVTGISVYNETKGEMQQEGVFEPLSNYQIHYILAPNAGWEFSGDHTEVEINQGRVYGEWSTEPDQLSVMVRFSTCAQISRVDLIVTPIAPGVLREDVVLSAPENANYQISEYYLTAEDMEEDWTVFEEGHSYNLDFTLTAKENYIFAEEVQVYINGEETAYGQWSDYTQLGCGKNYSFLVDYIYLEGLHSEIVPGSAQLPELAWEDQITVTDVKWVDADKQPVTNFTEGNVYYLAVTVQAQGSRQFFAENLPYVDTRGESEIQLLSKTEAVIYVRYSLEPDAGDIDVKIAGLQQGAKIEDVVISVAGNATVVNTEILDVKDYELVEEGTFASGKTYLIQVTLKPNSGYRFTYRGKITANGEEIEDYFGREDYMTVSVVFTTCKKLSSVELTVPTVAEGKDVSKLNVTTAKNANYTVEYSWVDVTDPDGGSENYVSGKLKEGHKYRLQMHVEPKSGYVFDEKTTFTLNGKKVDGEPYGYGTYAELWKNYSFMEQITKVEFPNLPASLTKGQEFPTNLKVAGNVNYTFSFQWSDIDGNWGDTVEENGIYILSMQVEPKEGYEFSDDVKVYVGKTNVTDSWLVNKANEQVEVIKLYNVGLPQISRVDLTIPKLEAGAAPEITIPADVNYVIAETAWAQSSDSKMDYEEENFTFGDTLVNGKYTFMGVLLAPAEGYAFAEKVTFYVNGTAITPDQEQNILFQNTVMLPMGKLGEFPQLTAPKVTVSGETLSWDSVLNADAYEIYRATSKSGKYTLLATVTDTTWADSADGKTYYYKVKAISNADPSKNSSYSSAVSVTFMLDAPVISVENDAKGKPMLSWAQVSGAKKYTVYRATAEDGKYTKLGTTTKQTYTDTKAKAGTTYFYKVIANASSSKYNSGYSNIVSCPVICGTPTVTVKIDANTGKPSLSWKKVDGAVKYAIYRMLPGEETFTLLAEQTALTYADNTAPIDTQCQYYVQALGSTEALNGKPSDVVSATSGMAKPVAIGSIDDISGKPVITWDAVEGAVTYEIYRSTKSTKGYSLVTTVENMTYIDDSVAAGKTYYYKVKAVGAVSTSAESSYVKLTGKCATPELFVENAENGKPCLKWYKVSGAKKYTIYRATSETGKYTKLGTTTKLTYTDTKASAGTTYFYKIVANGSKSSYNSGYSNVVSCGVICGTPSVTVKIDANTGKPSLSWGKVSGAAKYAVYRDGELLATVTTVTYADTTAAIDTQYTYTVQALGKTEDLNGAVSKAVTAISGIAKPVVKGTITDQGKPQLTWEAVEGAVKYEVYRSTKSNKGYVLLGDAYSTGVDDMSAAPGKTYYYKVKAIGAVSKSADSSYVKLTGKCAAPVITVENDSNGKPVISWSKVSGAKKYTIYRATTETGTYKSLGTTTKTSYTDSKATADTVYYYKVIANGSKSSYNSVYSNVCRTPAPAADTDGVMTYAEYMAAELDTPVVIECYVQATQSWWEESVVVYGQDRDGGYYIHNMACTEADAARLTAGTKIRVSGIKRMWFGEVEILEATFEFIDGADTFIAGPLDVTDLLGTDALEQHMNKKVTFKGMTVKSIEHKYEEPGDDIYVTLTKDGADFEFCIERYLTDPETEVYQKVCQLKSGDVVDLEGFLYWYEGPYTHITSVTVK